MVPQDLKNHFTDFRRLMQIASVGWWPLVLAAVLMFVSSIFEGVTMGLLIPMIDLIIKGGDSSHLSSVGVFKVIFESIAGMRFRYVFFTLLVLILLAAAIKNFTIFFSEMIISKVSRKVEDSLRVQIYTRYLAFSKKFLDESKIGNVIDLATNQVLVACEVFRHAHFFILNQILLVVYFLMMIMISWRLAIVSLLILPCTMILIRFVSKKITIASEYRFEIDQKISAYLIDSFTNINLIRTYVREADETDTYRKISKQSALNFHGIWKKIYFGSHSLDFLLTLSTGLLLAACLFVFIKEDKAGLAMFFGFFFILRRFTGSFSQIGDNYSNMTKSFVPIRKVLWVFDDKDKEFVPNGAAPFHSLRHEIAFKGVSFAYDDRAVLKNIDLKFVKGRMTAIVGPTGSGKTTIANLVPRFHDVSSGRIEVDGRDLRDYDLKLWRTKIAIVDQQVPILNGTIRTNILYGLTGRITDAELNEAVSKARLDDFISGLPAGVETQVGDRGIRLSGGEKQRLAIVRSILKKPEVFIFDEATSALDMETEIQIQKAVEDLTKDKTVIVIAHRLSTIRNADHIIVLEEGRVMEEGSFDDLIKKEERFYHYWKLNVFK